MIEQKCIWEYPVRWKSQEFPYWHDIRSKCTDKIALDRLNAIIRYREDLRDYYLLLYSYARQEYCIINVSGDPDTRSLYRLKRRLLYNSNKFENFITLTFPNESSGRYPGGKPFKNKLTLNQIRFYKSFGGHMRKFWNRIQQNRRNNKKKHAQEQQEIINYFWKFEQGSETNRPHVHAFIGNLNLNLPSFIDGFRPVFKVIEGKTWLVDGYIPPVSVKLHDELMHCWESGYIYMDTINDDGVKKYAGKYFSKSGSVNKRGRSRRWGTSRGINAVPKNPDYLFVDKSYDFEYLYEISKVIDFWSYTPYAWTYEYFYRDREIISPGNDQNIDYLNFG